MSRRVLFVTHEMPPFAGGPASGGGLRVWGLAEGLRARGFEVTISMPRAYLAGRADVPPEILEAAHDTRDIPKLLDRHRPDVLVLEQPRELGWHEQLDIPTVIDLPGPVFLENLYLGRAPDAELREKIFALSYGDLFLVSHARQKPYFLAWLALAGVDILSDRVAIVPFAFPPDLPPPATRTVEPTFIYSGTFHPWQDPRRALSDLVGILDELDTGTLEILGGKHPVDLYGEGVYADPLAGLSPSARILRGEPLAWRDYCARLTTRWAAINVLEGNVERENALPIRELNAMWCGLPPIVSPLSPFAAEIARTGAGWIVEPGDRAALRDVVREIVLEPGRVERAAERARALVRGRYTWDAAIEPLARFCAEPRRRAKRGRSHLVEATDRDLLVRYATELGQVAEAHRHTQDALSRRHGEYADLEARLGAAAQSLREREAELHEARAAAARERDQHAAALAREVAHKRELAFRLASDLEGQRKRASDLEGELTRLRRSPTYRGARIVVRLARPVWATAVVATAALAGWWAAPGAATWLGACDAAAPLATRATVVAVALVASLAVLRARFRWSWLTPVRSRTLGAVKLALLFFLSVAMMVYLKVWERLHKIRVFP